MSRVYISGIRAYALRRYSNTRPNRPAWRYQVSNGPNVRKSPKGAYRGRRGLLFLTKSSRTRAAEETLYDVHIITPASRDARVARARVSTDTLSGTLETLASRQAHDSSRERRSVLEPEEPGRGLSRVLYTLRSSSRTNSASPNVGRILRIPRGRARSPLLRISLVNNFSVNPLRDERDAY